MDTANSSGVSLSESIRLSGIKSVLAAPLENGGEVVALIYVDSRMGHRSFEEADLRLLTSLANVAAAKIQNARLMAEAAEKKQMDREFALAHEIQQRLLPDRPPVVAGYDFHGSNVPSRQVSGDYFDFRPRPDGKIYAAIADVCGKGVGPALLMASLQASFHAWADELVPVSEMTGRLSEAISRRTGPDRFITFFLVLVEPASGEIEYTNAGHNQGLVVRKDGTIEELPSHGLPLALFPGRPYGSSKFVLGSGRVPVSLHGRNHRSLEPGGRGIRPGAPEDVPADPGRNGPPGHRLGARAHARGICRRRAFRRRSHTVDASPASVSRLRRRVPAGQGRQRQSDEPPSRSGRNASRACRPFRHPAGKRPVRGERDDSRGGRRGRRASRHFPASRSSVSPPGANGSFPVSFRRTSICARRFCETDRRVSSCFRGSNGTCGRARRRTIPRP